MRVSEGEGEKREKGRRSRRTGRKMTGKEKKA